MYSFIQPLKSKNPWFKSPRSTWNKKGFYKGNTNYYGIKTSSWIVDKKEVKNFTWPEANHLAIYERDWEAALRTIKKKSS